jgi:hypothetical protein
MERKVLELQNGLVAENNSIEDIIIIIINITIIIISFVRGI